jgi:homoserine kinase
MFKKNYIKIFSPATIANFTCGFDIFGVALENPGDVVEIEINNNSNEIKILEITGDNGLLPYEIEKNTVTISLLKFLNDFDLKVGLNIKIHKKMPFGSGLGSSAASSVAGVYALNQMLENPLPKDKLLEYVLEGEKKVSGSIHADNVAACLYGGFIIVKQYPKLEIIKLNVKKNYYFSIIHPHIEVKTEDARKILRKDIKLELVTKQWGNIATTVIALQNGDDELLKNSLIDIIIEPVRSIFIPEFTTIKNIAYENGALAASISGSGPSVFSVFNDKSLAEITLNLQAEALKKIGISSDLYISQMNFEGVKVIP